MYTEIVPIIDKYGAESVIKEFQRIFEEGVDNFVQGDWGEGKKCFELCLQSLYGFAHGGIGSKP